MEMLMGNQFLTLQGWPEHHKGGLSKYKVQWCTLFNAQQAELLHSKHSGNSDVLYLMHSKHSSVFYLMHSNN